MRRRGSGRAGTGPGGRCATLASNALTDRRADHVPPTPVVPGLTGFGSSSLRIYRSFEA